jgi:hypothetical protein
LRATWRPLPGIRRSRPPGPNDRPGLGARNHADHTALRIAEARDPGAWGMSIGSWIVLWQRFITSRICQPKASSQNESKLTRLDHQPGSHGGDREHHFVGQARDQLGPTWAGLREPAELRRR